MASRTDTSGFGPFILRVSLGLMMLFGHGLGKIGMLGAEELMFADFLGLGPFITLLLVIFAEVAAAAFLVAGFLTRWSALLLAFTMFVAAFWIHGGDPLFAADAQGGGSKEFALIYGFGFLALVFTGAGQFSIDRMLGKKKKAALEDHSGPLDDDDGLEDDVD